MRGVRPDPGPDRGLRALSPDPELSADPDLGPPTTLVLIRHGRTADVGARLRGGDTSGPPLDAAGEGEVGALATALIRSEVSGWEGTGGREPAGVVLTLVCSPAARAHRTAAVIGTALGVAPVVDPAWAELSLGEWDGLGYAELAAGWPERYSAWRSDPDAAPPAGESITALAGRVRAARDRLLAARPGATVLVVTHTAPIRALVAEALGAGPAAMWRLRIDPASVTVLRHWADGGCEVATVNHRPQAVGGVR